MNLNFWALRGLSMSNVLLAQALMFSGEYHLTMRGRRLSIDFYSLPIPEGLAPLTPAYLDVHLTSLINQYTFRGIPILVHCRGGVGRAGQIGRAHV